MAKDHKHFSKGRAIVVFLDEGNQTMDYGEVVTEDNYTYGELRADKSEFPAFRPWHTQMRLNMREFSARQATKAWFDLRQYACDECRTVGSERPNQKKDGPCEHCSDWKAACNGGTQGDEARGRPQVDARKYLKAIQELGRTIDALHESDGRRPSATTPRARGRSRGATPTYAPTHG